MIGNKVMDSDKYMYPFNKLCILFSFHSFYTFTYIANTVYLSVDTSTRKYRKKEANFNEM
jgi:hypothetical protein